MERTELDYHLDELIGDGFSCYWCPGYLPQQREIVWESLLELALRDTLRENQFDQTATFEQMGKLRRLELLGPDSPGEFVFYFEPPKRDGTIETMELQRRILIEMCDWIQERRRIM